MEKVNKICKRMIGIIVVHAIVTYLKVFITQRLSNKIYVKLKKETF